MADTINNKRTIQIHSGLPSPLSDKSPSPATKLLISHGKPNFTIARSPKVEDNVNPLSPQPSANNNYNPYKCASNNSSSNNNSNIISNGNGNNKFVVGTKFNGVFKPSTAAASWATSNGNGNGTTEQNEAAKVVLRRPKLAEVETVAAAAAGEDDENVPEFIRRQRRIQERLAKENVLDFENRRSGYFTHVMISPDSPNRTSFVETMASPAIVPALEMPLPARIEEEEQQQLAAPPAANGHSEEEPRALLTNGHNGSGDYVAPEEVAQAIEEVNKAVAGEDDGSSSKTEAEEVLAQAEEAVAAVLVAAAAELEPVAVTAPAAEPEPVVAVAAAEPEPVAAPAAPVVEPVPSAVEAQVEVVTPVAATQNGHDAAITISHTNGQSSEVPSIATPDPSGALGVNYEPKQVTSFAQELGSGENNYPDTVQVVKESPASPADAQLQELTKLKFDIQSDGQNEVQVTPVMRAD